MRDLERRRRARLAAAAAVAGVVVIAGLMLAARDGSGELAAEPRPVDRFAHIHGVEVPATDPETVYVSTHEGLIRIGADGQWRYVSADDHDFMGFRAHPSDAGVLYSSGHPAAGSGLRNPVGFMISRDGGATWEPIALEGAADFHAMAVQSGDGDVIYGWSGGLHFSDDAGASWERMPAEALEQAGGALGLAVHPADADEVLAATRAGLLRSRDGGRSFEPVLAGAAVTAVEFVPGDADRLVAYVADPPRGLVRSEDGGQSWTELGWALDGDAAGHIAIHPQDPEDIYVATYGESLYRSRDGGRSFEPLAEAGVPR
ncbi:MAG TPA: hypothetical protein VML96_07595, partial [Egibacteraceae bacterium]|nr:hypothetical protein [Egibacteraceae bacterium]